MTEDCGCEERKRKLNSLIPGLGDSIGVVLDPIYNRIRVYSLKGFVMPEMLKPDMKAVVWLLIGAFAVPMVRNMLNI